jgi:hypothetical protein
MSAPILALVLLAGPGDYTVPGIETGDVMMTVQVWGMVNSPGSLLVPWDADLVEVISAAGGPSQGADLGAVRIVTGPDESEYDLAGYLEGDGGLPPPMSPGTTVYVPEDRSDWWKEALDIFYKIIVTVNLVWVMAER